MFLYDPEGTLLGYSIEESYPESIETTAPLTGKYLLLIAEYQGGSPFTLTLALGTGGSGNGGTSPNDAIELTEGLTVGTLPGPGQYLDLNEDNSPDGEIWYKIYLQYGDYIILTLSGPRNRTDFDLYLFGPPDDQGYIWVVANATNVIYPDITAYNVTETGWHYLCLLAYPYGDWDGMGEFSLLIELTKSTLISGSTNETTMEIGPGFSAILVFSTIIGLSYLVRKIKKQRQKSAL